MEKETRRSDDRRKPDREMKEGVMLKMKGKLRQNKNQVHSKKIKKKLSGK